MGEAVALCSVLLSRLGHFGRARVVDAKQDYDSKTRRAGIEGWC